MPSLPGSARPVYALASLYFRSTIRSGYDQLFSAAFAALVVVGLVYIWRTLYGNDVVTDGPSIALMGTYAVLGSLVMMSLQTNLVFNLGLKLHSGDIALDLVRPVRWQWSTLAEYLGTIAAQFVVLVVPIIVIAALFLDFQLPVSLAAAVAFLVSLALGVLINFSILFLIFQLGFRYIQIGGIESALRGFRPVLTGALVPIWFLPEWLAIVLQSTPFPQITYAPLSIYIGWSSGSEIFLTLAVQTVWLVALLGFGSWASERSIRKVVIAGG